MNCQDRSCPWRDGSLDTARIDIVGGPIDVYKDRCCPRVGDGVGGRYERKTGAQYLVAGPYTSGQQGQMQGGSARGHGYREGGTYVLGEAALELLNTGPLANPTAPEHLYNSPLLRQSKGRSSHGHSPGHHASHTASIKAGDAFTLFRQRINSRKPCSKATFALNSNTSSAFSTPARRVCTLATLRASRYSGRNDEPVSLRSRLQSAFRLVCRPLPTLNTSSVTSLCAANKFARAT